MRQTNPVSERSFVIVEPDPIIAMDLLGMLKTAFPSSPVTVSQMLADVADQITTSAASVSILLNSSLISEHALASLRGYTDKGARIVLVGAAVNVSFDASVVEMPFTSEMILNVL